MKRKTKAPKPVLLRGIDPELWKRFRLRALERGLSAGAYVSKLIEAELATNKGGPR